MALELHVQKAEEGSFRSCGIAAAATTLMKLMVDPATPASTRARCSEAIINFSSKAIELEDIEARLAALEGATEDSKKLR